MIPFPDRILCSFDDAEEATGLCRRKLYQLLPQIESRKIGRRRLLVVSSLIKHLGGEATDEAAA
jgi:hypothetical protein